MKRTFHYITLLAVLFVFASCDKDNYDEPDATLNGRLMYQGQPIGVERDQVPFELYQFGFGTVAPIRASFAQDGTYSSRLFNGQYKLIVPNNQGPFLWKRTTGGAPDTVTINLNGNQTLDLEVMPYYMIRNPQITAGGGKVRATFGLEKVITDANAKNIENVGLYINKTQFASSLGEENIAQATRAGNAITDMGNISLEVTVPSITPTQNYVFARVGVKIAGVEDRLFSQVVRLQY